MGKQGRLMLAWLLPGERQIAMNLGAKVPQSKVMNLLLCICVESKDRLKHQRLAEEIREALMHMGQCLK